MSHFKSNLLGYLLRFALLNNIEHEQAETLALLNDIKHKLANKRMIGKCWRCPYWRGPTYIDLSMCRYRFRKAPGHWVCINRTDRYR